ncbi:hypothetical protein I540_0599 [Mycobacteroides abscessus subsp. bolletii 1513]|uniref:Uncharacterized protein n=1 Tax=Mycobacteroides abscessus subsp. bolletii 1513 TaxID=1299321 RepID=X8DYV5_9MYCO|nr:hypothetical protein I540_0599 [Mycobacteroides abscessus subsp. bolletii 1513]
MPRVTECGVLRRLKEVFDQWFGERIMRAKCQLEQIGRWF